MAGELQLGGTTLATHTGSGASAKITLDSGLVFPANTIFYLGTATVTSTGAQDSSSSGFQNTGLEITISDVSAYSKIIVQASLVFRADPSGTFSLAAYKLIKSNPSVSTLNYHGQIGNPSTTIHTGTVTLLGIDTSLGSGSHTYNVQYSRVLSSNVTYLGTSGSISTLVAYGVV